MQEWPQANTNLPGKRRTSDAYFLLPCDDVNCGRCFVQPNEEATFALEGPAPHQNFGLTLGEAAWSEFRVSYSKLLQEQQGATLIVDYSGECTNNTILVS